MRIHAGWVYVHAGLRVISWTNPGVADLEGSSANRGLPASSASRLRGVGCRSGDLTPEDLLPAQEVPASAWRTRRCGRTPSLGRGLSGIRTDSSSISSCASSRQRRGTCSAAESRCSTSACPADTRNLNASASRFEEARALDDPDRCRVLSRGHPRSGVRALVAGYGLPIRLEPFTPPSVRSSPTGRSPINFHEALCSALKELRTRGSARREPSVRAAGTPTHCEPSAHAGLAAVRRRLPHDRGGNVERSSRASGPRSVSRSPRSWPRAHPDRGRAWRRQDDARRGRSLDRSTCRSAHPVHLGRAPST